MGSLAGIKIIAFTHYAAGPMAAQYLGALGADTIKIEPPSGDGQRVGVRDPDGLFNNLSPYFMSVNRNQRCVTVDLKTEQGKQTARKLIETADVVLENYRPGTLERLGLGYEEVKEINSRIVYCSISGYDRFGPARDAPGQDLLIQSLSGLAGQTGNGDGPPVPAGTYVIDHYTALNAVIGVLSALRYRDLTGIGQWVRLDMMSAALHLMCSEASYSMNVGTAVTRSRAGLAHVYEGAPYGIYETRDGAITISCWPTADFVRAIAKELGVIKEVEPYLTDRDVVVQRDKVAIAFAKRIKNMTQVEAMAAVTRTGAWAVPCRTLDQALKDPAVVASGIIQEMNAPDSGRHRVVIEPLKMSESPIVCSRPAPGPGEHTEEVLKEIENSHKHLMEKEFSGTSHS